MSAAKHTPGPWTAYKRPEPVGYAEWEIHYGTDTECVAEVVHEDANALLIAAAPELLAALEAALTVIDDYLTYEHNGDPWTEDARAMGEMDIDDYERDGRLESARAAIAKATGAAK